jgi:UDP-2-acetamido-3-amino-2,3-dideoxy-glucuronate N-acetyltransferase
MVTKIWQPTNLYGNYKIGKGTKIGAFCDIGGKIGKNCVIQTMVSVPPLTIVKDNVFLGPGVKIMNDKHMDGNLKGLVIGRGAKIGMGTLICANIGKNSIIGAGSVVLHDVPDGEVWIGNPAIKLR